ncbi:type VI secretion system protein TssL, long form [Paracoccus sp. (in: a-proteobacteria)]|uniref:type VI secretion system protein TssL, long form n=1 Tax=Paracoccus sp. TaxID=267 RepID=UPI0026E032F6|nr:type VI secretion system protein TssL, long form [Paracoccus sp. (in: a-proteobacteria)]
MTGGGTMDDDFADGGPRVVLPTPGRRLPEALPEQPLQAPTLPEDGFSAEAIMRGFRLEGRDFPVMIGDAAGLLNLAHSLRHRKSAPDLAALRSDIITAVREYERNLGRAGILPEQARAAHYVICATLDDVIRNTSWGRDWQQQGLVSTFHHDVTGGDKVFDLLTHFQSRPGSNRDILLLIYLCLSLGFEGRTRVSARGALELAQIRDSLYHLLRQQYGVPEQDLSPHWKGEDMGHRPLRRGRLFWLLTGLAVLALCGLFVTLNLLLGRISDRTVATMVSLPPGETPSLFIPEPAPVAEPEPDPEPVVAETEPAGPSPIDTLVAFLQPEVEEGLVRLYRDGDAVLVRIANAGAFQPGGAEIQPQFLETFQRIGLALAAEDFDVTILGHTDNIPIRTAAYPSNFHLSTARASAVRDLLLNYVPADRIAIRGEAETRPIATNSTPEGREANRRTEILVAEAGARVPPALLEQGGLTPEVAP